MYVDLELDKPRRLRFDLRAIRDLERMTGKAVGEIIRDLRNVGINAIIACLLAGLRHEDSALTENLVTKILEQYLENGGSIRPVLKAIDEALSESGLLKRAGEDSEGNAQPEPATTESR